MVSTHVSIRNTLLYSLLYLLFVFTSTHIAHAQSGAGIGIIPASIEDAFDTGSSIEEVIKITNESNETSQYYIYTRDIKGVENGGVPIFAEPGAEVTGFELTEWISLKNEQVVVEPGQTIEYVVTFNVPQDATPGSHFGGILVSVEPPRLREIGAGVGY